VPSKIFTTDGALYASPTSATAFPTVQSNVVPIHLSMGAYNCLPAGGLPCLIGNSTTRRTGSTALRAALHRGFPDKIGAPPDAFQDGEIGKLQSIVPGSGPAGVKNKPQVYGDNPNRAARPRSLRCGRSTLNGNSASGSSPAGSRMRFCWTCMRDRCPSSPGRRTSRSVCSRRMPQRSPRVDQTADGVISAIEGDVDTAERRVSRQHSSLSSCDRLQPLRGDPRDQRRPVGAAVRAQPAGLGAAGLGLSRSSRRSLPRSVAMPTTGEAAEPRATACVSIRG